MLKTNHPNVKFNDQGELIVADTPTTVLELAFEHKFGASLDEQLRIHPELEKHQLLDALGFYFEHESALLKYLDKNGVLVLSLAKAAVIRLRGINFVWGYADEPHKATHAHIFDPALSAQLLN